MLHHHHNLLDASDEIHGAAHAFDHLAWNHPVGEIAILGHLHGAEDRQIDVAAAYHGDTVGRRKRVSLGNVGERLRSHVDQLHMFDALILEGTKAEDAVLALELDAD